MCADLFGGSVNNEFTKIVQTRPNTHLVTNMNLPLLIQLLFVPDSTPIDEAIRQIVEADDTKVKYVNDLLGQAELDEFLIAREHIMIQMIRVDYRLLHGQVAVSWTFGSGCRLHPVGERHGPQ